MSKNEDGTPRQGMGRTFISDTMLIRQIYDKIESILQREARWRRYERALQARAEWLVFRNGEEPGGLSETLTNVVDGIFQRLRPASQPPPETETPLPPQEPPAPAKGPLTFTEEFRGQVAELATVKQWDQGRQRSADLYVKALTSKNGHLPRACPQGLMEAIDKIYDQLRKEPRFAMVPVSLVFVQHCFIEKLRSLLNKSARKGWYSPAQWKLAFNYAVLLVRGKTTKPKNLDHALALFVRKSFVLCYRQLENEDDFRGVLTLIPSVRSQWFAEVSRQLKPDEKL